MFSHVTVGTRDLERAGRFYDALLVPIGWRQRVVTPDDGPLALCWVSGDAPLPRFYVYGPYDERPATVGNGSMTAFLAPSAEAVRASWAAGLANGGMDEGAPGERPHYGEGYFGAICATQTETRSTSSIAATLNRARSSGCFGRAVDDRQPDRARLRHLSPGDGQSGTEQHGDKGNGDARRPQSRPRTGRRRHRGIALLGDPCRNGHFRRIGSRRSVQKAMAPRVGFEPTTK